MAGRFGLLVCGNYRRELEAVMESGDFQGVAAATYPAGCGRPAVPWDSVLPAVQGLGDCRRVEVLGCCCIAGVEAPPTEAGHCRLRKISQCFHMFADRKVVEGYQRDGAYLLTPGWLDRWEHWIGAWGFDEHTAPEFFKESADHFLLLDTGVYPDSAARLANLAEFTGLPFEIVPTGLDFFRLLLGQRVLEWRLEDDRARLSAESDKAKKQAGDYAMIVDLLNGLAQTFEEGKVVDGILELFSMLFAPGDLLYLPWAGGEPGELRSLYGAMEPEPGGARERLAHFEGVHEWTASGKGFRLRIAQQAETVAVVEVDRIAFPEHRRHYLGLALSIAGVCGLAIGNARKYRQLKDAEAAMRRYAADLERANEEVKRFAYIVSHDLRAPLVNLTGFSAELARAFDIVGPAARAALPGLDAKEGQSVTLALDEDIPEALEFVRASVKRMDRFINALLRLARMGRHELSLEPVDMAPLVREALAALAHQIEETRTTATVGALPQVVGDRTAMEQIIGNLLNNAVKFLDTARPGEIEITGEEDAKESVFRVRDNGRGIAAKEMDKIFVPFRRAGKQDTQGEGMGLAYVQALVARHGGRIWCDSQLGVGTTFTFTISHADRKKENRPEAAQHTAPHTGPEAEEHVVRG